MLRKLLILSNSLTQAKMLYDLSPFGVTSHSHTHGWTAIVFTFEISVNAKLKMDSDLEGSPEFELSQEGEKRPDDTVGSWKRL